MLGVSPDTVRKHQRFRARYELPYRLLADTERTVSRAYGVWRQKSFFGRKFMGVARTTFVIDRKGIVAHVFEDVSILGHAAEVARAVAALD